MTTLQTEFTEGELLADHPIEAPLLANGVRCHGGFDGDGAYVSPRTLHRWPAIGAWEEQRLEQFGTPIIDVPLEAWPAHFPNVEQSKFLIRHGVTSPTIGELSRIGTVEGFGGVLRTTPTPEFARCFAEEIDGTAIAHIDGGLFEAHARDESGFGDQAGHDRMWFAARDIAFDNPVTEDQTATMLQRMGITGGPGSAPPPPPSRVLPDDIDPVLESVLGRMIGLLLIEISAFHGFRWAEAVLADDQLVAGDGEAARLIAYIRSDETPHVAWLRTAISEMRDRTWVGSGGRTHDGAVMVDRLWTRALDNSVVLRRQASLDLTMAEVERAVAGRADGADLVEEMLSLGTVERTADGGVVDSQLVADAVSVDER
jgi:hypothetical protein